MDLAGFIDLLDKADLDLTPIEVAEALWLARYATPTTRVVTGEPDKHGQAPSPQDPPERRQLSQESGPSPGAEARLPLYLPTATGAMQPQRTGTGARVRVPASTALPGSLALLRSLRPLKLRAPDVRRRALDETATADATARAGVVVPVLRAAQERRYSLTLVIDTGPAMAVWAKLEAELTVLLQRLGAFRDLQRWYLRSEAGVVLGVSRAARAQLADRALHEPSELLDPAGSRLILLLTDGSGSAWYSGAMARTLRLWGTGGPVAILQPLPQQLWTRTALAPVRGRLSAARQATPNIELDFTAHGRAARRHRPMAAVERGSGPQAGDGADERPVYVPVLEIGPDWLGSWSRFVSATSYATLDCAVTLAATRSEHVPSAPARVAEDDSASERVRQFTEQASPEALRLATYLAAAPLSLPVIRHVQLAMLPDSRPSHLAEILLGGLVTTHGMPDAPDEPERWRYEFNQGVRDLLLSGLGRADAYRVLTAVSHELTARFGRGADEFTAIAAAPAADPEALASVSTVNRPFAAIAAHVLARITGDFTDASAADRAAASALTDAEPQAPGYPAGLTDPVSVFVHRYQRTGRIPDIDAAIAALRGAAAQAPPMTGRQAPPEREISAQLELAAALQVRYLALGDKGDLDEATDLLRASQSTAAPGSTAVIHQQLATALGLRYARTGSPADITEAIEAARAAVGQVGPGTEKHARYASTLGELLLRRAHDRSDRFDLADVEEAITCLTEASEQPAVPYSIRAELHTNLSKALRERAMWGGTGSARDSGRRSDPQADLDAAVRAIRRAIELTSPSTGGQRGRELASRHAELGAALLARALGVMTSAVRHPSRSGRPADDAATAAPAAGRADLISAAENYRTAASLTPPENEQMASYLAGLGLAMHELALITRADSDLTEAVKALRESIAQTYPDDPAGPERLARLAAAMHTRYEFSGNRGYLVEACQLLAEAATTSPPMGGERAGYLTDLGALYERSYQATGANRDLHSAADAYRRAVAALASVRGSDDVDTLNALLKLARALNTAGRSDEALATVDALLPVQERVLGPDHPDLAAARRLKEGLH